LILTLGWKWVVSSRLSISTEPEEQIAGQNVAGFLARNYFNVVGPQEVVFGMQLMEATAGACHMRIAISASRGWHRDLIGKLARPGDRMFVVFDGVIYPEQPMWRTVPDFLWSRLLTALGFDVHASPVITVMAGPNCEAERLPWNELVQYLPSRDARPRRMLQAQSLGKDINVSVWNFMFNPKNDLA
jgi:hypothetical protein